MAAPLVVAAHGTRDPDGEADAHAFVERLREALPGVEVHVGFIELSNPPLVTAMTAAASHAVGQQQQQQQSRSVTVLPLMLARGGHAKDDIPGAMHESAAAHPDLSWDYAAVLGPDPALVGALRQRVNAARGEVPAEETSVLLVGRGCSDADANATLATTARLLYETGGYAMVETAYIAVASPDIAAGLTRLRLLGAQHVVAVPYVLFRGLMRGSVADQGSAWVGEHPGAFASFAVAETLGQSDAVIELAARRYHEASAGDGCPAGSACARTATAWPVAGGSVSPQEVKR